MREVLARCGHRTRLVAAAIAVGGLLALTALSEIAPSAAFAPARLAGYPLQPLIDATPEGGTLILEPARYAGPAVIRRPMTMHGRAGAMIDGGGIGTVLSIEADDVTVSGLTFTHSGDRNDGIDAALRLSGQRAVIEDNAIEDCLYGIQLQQSNGNIIRRNRISSMDLPESRRGDAVRIWYSTENLVEANDISGVRDGFGIQAVGNRLRHNTVRDSRYGIQLLHGDANEITGNRLIGNAVGIMAIASDGLLIEANAIRSGRDVAGQGIIFKDTSRARVLGNDLFSNSQAVYIDASPNDIEAPNLFRGNRIAFNGISVTLHSDLAGNIFEANAFLGNHAEVAVQGSGTATRNVWRDNVWDVWEGFDRNGDAIGDTPFEVWSWTDRIWMERPDAQLFRAAPSLTVLDFVDRLAAFTEPRLMLRDPTPRVPRAREASVPEALR